MQAEVDQFQEVILGYYRLHGRTMPWRVTQDPYRILVSEFMLQQTQVPRVMEKYDGFLLRFPSIMALARANLRDVLSVWQGLGYNRRARYLHQSAQLIVSEHGGTVPAVPDLLQTLPGIGPGTAGAVAAFAYNRPVAFIETNIRRVYIHFFFPERDRVYDRDILPLIETTLVQEDPRRFYYALMDYGVMLSRETPNPNRRSAHYAKQSPFENSNRQIRGRILRELTHHDHVSEAQLAASISFGPERTGHVLETLIAEGLIVREGDHIYIAPS